MSGRPSSMQGGDDKCVKSLALKTEGKRSGGERRRGWKYSAEVQVRGVQCKDRSWTKLAQDRDQLQAVVDTVKNPRVP
jgi:hypothetical protein